MIIRYFIKYAFSKKAFRMSRYPLRYQQQPCRLIRNSPSALTPYPSAVSIDDKIAAAISSAAAASTPLIYFKGKRIITVLINFRAARHTLVQRTNLREAAALAPHGEGGIYVATAEEKPCAPFCRVGFLFFFRIKFIKFDCLHLHG